MKKVIVTGGAGFIGSHLVDHLVDQGLEVHVIDNLIAGKKEDVNPKATLHVLDIINLKDIEPVFKGADTVFHLAALPRVQDSIDKPAMTHEVNVTGTLNTLIASANNKVRRYVFTSSAAVYGDQTIMPLDEKMEPTPKSPYGLHKLIGEQYAKLWNLIYGLETVSLRYFNVYGPRQSATGSYPLVIAKFMDLRKQGKPLTITGTGEQTRDFVHVKDIVRANSIAANLDSSLANGNVFNIGSGKETSVNEIAALIGGPVVKVPARLEPSRSVASISKTHDILKFTTEVSLKTGIDELLKL